MTRPDFSRRSTDNELMDDATIGFAEFADCLRQLEFINICTLAYAPTLNWLGDMTRRGQNATLLDAGSGGGDMLRRIAVWAERNGQPLTLTGIDINPWSALAASTHTSALPIAYETGDVFAIGAGGRRFDLIVSALFTHHLPDATLIDFIRWMEAHAAQGWFVNDLHRHPVAYYFIKAATAIFSRNRLIQHDAAVSVARGFTKAEWQDVLRRAGVPLEHVIIRWNFPFRYTVARRK